MIAPFLSSLCQSRRNLSKFRMSVSYFTINRRSALPFSFPSYLQNLEEVLTGRGKKSTRENRLGKAAEPKSASVRLRFFSLPLGCDKKFCAGDSLRFFSEFFPRAVQRKARFSCFVASLELRFLRFAGRSYFSLEIDNFSSVETCRRCVNSDDI